VTTHIPEEGMDLVISDASRIGLGAFHALTLTLVQSVGPAGLLSGIAMALVTSAAAVVSHSLQDCPFAPAGVSVLPDWDPVTHDSMLRCQHPGHCWDRKGKYYPCP
jgi:hypothetical protein